MSSIKLKPCPFCGGPAALWRNAFANESYVECEDCGVRGGRGTSAVVVRAWNRRTKEKR